MKPFRWTTKFETGISVIDTQHQELFRRIDHLTLALYDGEGKVELKDLLSYLDTYVNEHFKTEESLLQQNNFPQYDKHLDKHRSFRELFSSVKQDFQSKGGDSYLAIRFEKEVRQWWELHILKADMEYVPYIKKI